MKNELTKKQMRIKLRNGDEIWVDQEIANPIIRCLIDGETRHIVFDGEVINAADIVSILKPVTVKKNEKISKGDWKCDHGYWHQKGQQCAHGELAKYDAIKNEIGKIE